MRDEYRKLQHSKRVVKGISKGQRPSVSEIKNGEFEVMYIIGEGLYFVANHENKLYYLKFSESL